MPNSANSEPVHVPARRDTPDDVVLHHQGGKHYSHVEKEKGMGRRGSVQDIANLPQGYNQEWGNM